jgi:phosphoglycerol transferase MdoB-like AlkP superfamily enzyme
MFLQRFSEKLKFIDVVIAIYISFFFTLLVFISIADIPYFKFFLNRFSDSALQWLGSFKVMFEMIVQNKTNLLFTIVAVISSVSCFVFIWKTIKKQLLVNDLKTKEKFSLRDVGLFILFSFIIFIGIRGTSEQPLRQGDAFHCNDPLLNQIGLNPGYTLMRSYFTRVNLMEVNEAIKNTKAILKVNASLEEISPFARKVISDSAMRKYNVVLVLMESMSANYLEAFGNKDHLTPNVDSLCKSSWFFTNAYSAGIHTNNGIFSTLFSFPAMKRIRPMSTVPLLKYTGIPYTLKQNGYENLFFCPHSESFDNIGVFIPLNHFDKLYSNKDYPREKSIGAFGVPDDYLFDFALKTLDERKVNKPFFATILTASNHEPYTIPSTYKKEFAKIEHRSVSYADWAIGKFINEVKHKAWFENTIFVFSADHGLNVGENKYEMALSYNHIPILFYAPKILGAKQLSNFMGQIDVFPTLMGLMNATYTNNTLGMDVLSDTRECMYFSADSKIGCVDSTWLYVYTFGGGEGLYKYKSGDAKDHKEEFKSDFERLRRNALSQTQAAEYMINNNKTELK